MNVMAIVRGDFPVTDFRARLLSGIQLLRDRC